MNISYKQNDNFTSAIADSDLLKHAIEWINVNLNPDDVFDSDKLEEWAEENGYVKKEG